MDTDPSGSGGWRFAQCFGDKGEVEDITEGMSFLSFLASAARLCLAADIVRYFAISGHHLHRRVRCDRKLPRYR